MPELLFQRMNDVCAKLCKLGFNDRSLPNVFLPLVLRNRNRSDCKQCRCSVKLVSWFIHYPHSDATVG